MSAGGGLGGSVSSEANRDTASAGLLRTKLRARGVRSGLVARPRLIARLEEGRGGGLVLVSAPAGFGKTTLLAEWIAGWDQAARRFVGWLGLDAGDNDSARFLAYVIAALQEAAPGVGEAWAVALRSPNPPGVQVVVAGIVNEMAGRAEEITLVLDDFHAVTNPAVHAAVGCLLDNLPPNLHVVIATRADPPVPLAKLRARGQVVEVRGEDLRFTVDEAAAFLGTTMGLRLSREQAAALAERTEGWAAGLQLAALSMRGREDVDGFICAFAGTNRYILDFLMEEVLAREPEPVQRFLLETSVLTRLCGPLCDAVTGGQGATSGQRMLEGLERRNVFVTALDDDRRWYRYHHLFADLLQARLQQEATAQNTARAAQLQARAARWCDGEGLAAEAVGYALAARDDALAAALVERYWGPVASAGEVETAWGWLCSLPASVVQGRAELSLAVCWVQWLRGEVGAIAGPLADVERALREADSSASDPVLEVQAAALRSIVARYDGDFTGACAQAEAALAQLEQLERERPERLPAEVKATLWALVMLALGSAYDGAGDLERAVWAYGEIVRWSRVSRSATGIGVTIRLVGALRVLERLDEAEAACREALHFVEAAGMGRLPAVGVVHLALAGVLVERGALSEAEREIGLGYALGQHSGRFDAARNAAGVLVRLRLAQGDAAGALAAVQEAEAATGVTRGDAPPLERAGLLALRAEVLVRLGEVADAERCAQEAVRWAGGDRGQTGRMVAAAMQMVEEAQVRGHRHGAGLIEPLTEREVEVLRLVAAGLTNEEIAERLVVAVGTVKTHVHNVMGKLGARNRVEAVAQARTLGLV